MDDDDGEFEESGEQRRWQETARRVHVQLDKMVELMPAMKPDEVKTFIDTLGQAVWLQHQAETLDKRIEKERSKMFD